MNITLKRHLIKIVAALLCLAVTISLAACGVKSEVSQASENKSQIAHEQKDEENKTLSVINSDIEKITDECAVSAYKEILNKMAEYSQTDYASFANLFRNTDEETIKSLFNQVYKIDNYYAISGTYYNVAGKHPNTKLESLNYNFVISFENGEWKAEENEETESYLNSLLLTSTNVYPEDLMKSFNNGLNATSFDAGCCMYLDKNAVFEGCTHTSVKFAWQDSDGNLYVDLWFANGTDSPIYYKTCTVSLTDDSYGKICNVSTDINTSLKPHGSMMYTVMVPASYVMTGNAVWGEVNSSCNIKFE